MSDEYEYQYEYWPDSGEQIPTVSKKTVDHNWNQLRAETATDQEPLPPIERVSNVRAYVYSDSFRRGSLSLKTRRGQKQAETERFNFDFVTVQPQGVSQQHYAVWDLLKSLAATRSWRLERAEIYEPYNNENTTREISLFRISQRFDQEYILLVNPWAFVVDWRLETNQVLTTRWQDRRRQADFELDLQNQLRR